MAHLKSKKVNGPFRDSDNVPSLSQLFGPFLSPHSFIFQPRSVKYISFASEKKTCFLGIDPSYDEILFTIANSLESETQQIPTHLNICLNNLIS